MNAVHYSSASHEWSTPQPFFDRLDREFGFTLDAAATAENAKCARYFSAEADGLAQDWTGTVFVNPPYGRMIGRWIRKAFESAQAGHTVVALIPAKTETEWWHGYVMRAEEIRLVRGSLVFGGMEVGDRRPGRRNAPFPSALVIFRPGMHTPRFTTMDRIAEQSA